MVINFPGLTFVLQSYNPIMLQAAGSYFRENACCVCLRFDEMQKRLKRRNKSAVRFTDRARVIIQLECPAIFVTSLLVIGVLLPSASPGVRRVPSNLYHS